TGKGGGLAGLLYAAALKANILAPGKTAGDPNNVPRLTPSEGRHLPIGTVANFYNPPDATHPTKYPTKSGFARRFGDGRPNARHAVDNVLAGKIPPEVEITSPRWFEVENPDRTPMVSIDGRISIRGAAQNPSGVTFDYTVEYAPGVDPDDAAFQ